jgi:hypothetical protein
MFEGAVRDNRVEVGRQALLHRRREYAECFADAERADTRERRIARTQEKLWES